MAESNSVSSSSSSSSGSSSIKFKSVSSSESSENSDEDIRRSRYSRFLNMAPVPQNSDIGAASKVKTKLSKALEVISDHGCEEIVKCWGQMYGFELKNAFALEELSDELIRDYEQFMHQKVAKQQKYQAELLTRMYAMGEEAVRLEKALGVNSVVDKIPMGPLVDMEDHLSYLLSEFKDVNRRNHDSLTELQQKEQELCSILEIKPMPFERKDIISVEDLQEYEQRVKELEGEKNQLELDFEDNKNELYQLIKECELRPLSKMERYVFGEEHLITISKAQLTSLIMTVNQYRHRKANMITEIERHKEQVLSLFQTLRKDREEIDQFMETVGGFTNSILEKLRGKLQDLNIEKKENLKEIIERHRAEILTLWDKCRLPQTEREKFKAYYEPRLTDELLAPLVAEIEKLKERYTKYKRLYYLAETHEKFWNQMLELDNQANNKDRLFQNRGGQLLAEEKQRKHLEKVLPDIREQICSLLQKYFEENGEHFSINGESLLLIIKRKETLRRIAKQREKDQRKKAIAENTRAESRYGVPAAGIKRKAPTTPSNCPNKTKFMKTVQPSTSRSTISQKSSTSTGQGTHKDEKFDEARGGVSLLQTPARAPNTASSSPDSGSISYESFQNFIDKSKNMPHNSTRNIELPSCSSKNINHTTTQPKTPTKTPGQPLMKTPNGKPYRIPFKVPTSSKIPSQIPVTPRQQKKNQKKPPFLI